MLRRRIDVVEGAAAWTVQHRGMVTGYGAKVENALVKEDVEIEMIDMTDCWIEVEIEDFGGIERCIYFPFVLG